MTILQLILFSVAVTSVLSIVGFAPVWFLAPNFGGLQVLLCPTVGLAILYFACQVLSSWIPSGTIVIGTCIVFGILSVATAAKYRKGIGDWIRPRWREVALVAGFALVLTIVLQVPMIHSGTFTLANGGGDDLFTWAPTAAYMQTHAFPVGGSWHSLAYISPVLYILPENIYPGSAGTVDGGLMSIFHMHAYQFIEPFTAICLAMTAVGVYLLVRVGLRLPRRFAVVGLVLAATNQYIFFIAGEGLAQDARGMVLLIAVLVLLLVTFREQSIGAGILGGGITGVLAGVYMPQFLVAFVAIAGGAIAFVLLRGRPSSVWKPMTAFAVAGLLLGAQNVKWLLFDGGLHAWALQSHLGTVHFLGRSVPFEYLAGSAPFLKLQSGIGLPQLSGGLGSTWTVASMTIAALALLLVCVGIVSMAIDRLLFEMCTLGAPLLLAAYVTIADVNGLGAISAIGYVTPIGCALVSYATYKLLTRFRVEQTGAHVLRSQRALRLTPLAVGVGIVVASICAFQVNSSALDESFFFEQPGSLPPSSLPLSELGSVVPSGATVLVYTMSGTSKASSYAKFEVLVGAVDFLRAQVTLVGGFSPYTKSQSSVIEDDFAQDNSYILHYQDRATSDPKVPSNYRAIWWYRPDHLVLYKRDS